MIPKVLIISLEPHWKKISKAKTDNEQNQVIIGLVNSISARAVIYDDDTVSSRLYNRLYNLLFNVDSEKHFDDLADFLARNRDTLTKMSKSIIVSAMREAGKNNQNEKIIRYVCEMFSEFR